MHVQWVAKYIIYNWDLPSFFDCFLTVDEHLDNPTTLNLSRLVNFRNKAARAKRLLLILRLWSSISSPQIRQSKARCWTWISIRLITLFWPWKEKRQRLVLMRKKVITRLREKPGSGKRTCFGPRNSKIAYQNSRLSTILTFNIIKVNRYDNRGKISRTL